MAKGYWIAHVNVTDPYQYKHYVAASAVVFKEYNVCILARGGEFTQLEGNGRPRNVVLEFESYEDAVACYNSPGYQAAKALRKNAGEADIVIVEGA
jgi:uncharacterized protein (DUF1330 family)